MNARVIASAVALALLAAGCSSGDDAVAEPSTPATTTVAPTTEAPADVRVFGVFGLPFGAAVALDLTDGASECQSAGPDYSAVEPGAQVQVLDSAGAIVGTGELGEAVALVGDDGARLGCTWPYDVTATAGGAYYTVKVLDWSTDAVAESDLATQTVNILPVK